MILSAHQPAYIPWSGFIHKILSSEIFVILDNVQFEKNSFINRNTIKTNQGSAWLTIPVKAKGHIKNSLLEIQIDEQKNSVVVYCLVSANSKTGVEMEALSGINSALLAIYDLSKIVEANLKITNTKLLVKSGGKKGLWINPDGIPDKIKNTLNL